MRQPQFAVLRSVVEVGEPYGVGFAGNEFEISGRQ